LITSFDDYLIHQAVAPITKPSSSDRNWYDRHWMNGFDANGDVWFMVGFGVYPNRRVMDAHISFVVGDTQHTLHASRRAPSDRGQTRVGPISVEIVEALRTLRVVVDEGDERISCDLTFTACTAPFEEPDNVMDDDGRLTIHTSRYSQRGVWNGTYTLEGVTRALTNAFAMRDRSWGIRPVGEPEGGAPSATHRDPGVFLLWSSLIFDEQWLYYTRLEDTQGRAIQSTCDMIPMYAAGNVPAEATSVPMARWEHDVEFVVGTRRVSAATIRCRDHDGTDYAFSIEPFGRPFYMLGIGYQHPKWSHGLWKGELAVEVERHDLAAIDPMDFAHLHVSQRCRVTWGDRMGFATLENLVLGKCERYGFTEFVDGAARHQQ
jgi:hypothetical protein